MRKFIYSLLLTVLLGIPLSTKATIVDDLRFSLLKRETRFTFLIISMKIISTNMFLSLYSIFIVYNK